MDASAKTSSYLKRHIYSVAGWLTALDARFIASLAAWQAQHKIAGSLAEIGVYHGKLFFILALSRRDGEQALAIDLFEDEASHNRNPSRWPQALTRRAQRLNIPLAESEILKADSLILRPEDILERVGPTRLFSVDGGHLFGNVENDLNLAVATSLPEAVVIVDDFCNAEWPEVTFATYDFLKTRPNELVPAAMTKHKLYLARPAMAAAYSDHAHEFALQNPRIRIRVMEMMGHKLPYMTVSGLDRLIDGLRSRLLRQV